MRSRRKNDLALQLRFQRGQCIPAERCAFFFVLDQLHQHEREFGKPDDTNGVAAGKEIDDVAEVLVVVAGDDGNAIQSGFQDVVSAARHEAAADEGDSGHRIERGQLSNAIDQEDAASERFAAPQGSLRHAEAEFSHEVRDFRKALGMAGRKDHHRLGMIGENVAKRGKQGAFFIFQRAAANQNWAGCGVSEVLAETGNDRWRGRRGHVEFEVAGDGDLRFWRTNLNQPAAVFVGLRQKKIDVGESLLQQSRQPEAETLVAGQGAVGNTAVDDSDAGSALFG